MKKFLAVAAVSAVALAVTGCGSTTPKASAAPRPCSEDALQPHCGGSAAATTTEAPTTTVDPALAAQAAKAEADDKVAADAKALADAQAATAAAKVAYEAQKNTAADGVYAVGTDINPGRWHTSGSSDDCYFAVLSGPGGDIVNNGFTAGPQYAQAAAGQYLELNGGCTWQHV